MNKLFILVTIVIVTMVISTVSVFSNDLSIGTARLREINESGIKARIVFLDTGSQLIVIGKASGLDPNEDYISLVYNVGSVPSGPTACTPTDGTLTSDQMNVGMWTVANNGTGSLFAVKTEEFYAGLNEIGTMSVRVIDNQPPPDLQACGRVQEK